MEVGFVGEQQRVSRRDLYLPAASNQGAVSLLTISRYDDVTVVDGSLLKGQSDGTAQQRCKSKGLIEEPPQLLYS